MDLLLLSCYMLRKGLHDFCIVPLYAYLKTVRSYLLCMCTETFYIKDKRGKKFGHNVILIIIPLFNDGQMVGKDFCDE